MSQELTNITDEVEYSPQSSTGAPPQVTNGPSSVTEPEYRERHLDFCDYVLAIIFLAVRVLALIALLVDTYVSWSLFGVFRRSEFVYADVSTQLLVVWILLAVIGTIFALVTVFGMVLETVDSFESMRDRWRDARVPLCHEVWLVCLLVEIPQSVVLLILLIQQHVEPTSNIDVYHRESLLQECANWIPVVLRAIAAGYTLLPKYRPINRYGKEKAMSCSDIFAIILSVLALLVLFAINVAYIVIKNHYITI